MSVPPVDIVRATKRYGALVAVDGLSLALEPGETVALLGHNGAGKTTLIKLILGLVRPNGGEVRVFGEPAGHRRAIAGRRHIGFLPEVVPLYDAMTGVGLLRFYARLKGVPAGGCGEALERVGLGEAANKRIATYSKGMRQRLGLAQALLGRPRLLLLDEPTSGLDPTARRAFYETVRAMAEGGAAVLLSTHALSEVEAQEVSRVAIMKRGRLAACGALETLRAEAALPTRIRVFCTPGGATAVAERLREAGGATLRVNGRAVELACAQSEAMAIMGCIADLDGTVCETEIRPPTLDALYAHYRGGEARP